MMLGLSVKQVVHYSTPGEGAFLSSVEIDKEVSHSSVSIISHIILPLIKDVCVVNVAVQFPSHICQSKVLISCTLASLGIIDIWR